MRKKHAPMSVGTVIFNMVHKSERGDTANKRE